MNDLNNENTPTIGTTGKFAWRNSEAGTILQSEVAEVQTTAGPLVVAGYLLILVTMTVIIFVG